MICLSVGNLPTRGFSPSPSRSHAHDAILVDTSRRGRPRRVPRLLGRRQASSPLVAHEPLPGRLLARGACVTSCRRCLFVSTLERAWRVAAGVCSFPPILPGGVKVCCDWRDFLLSDSLRLFFRFSVSRGRGGVELSYLKIDGIRN